MRHLNGLRTIAVTLGLGWLETPLAEAGLIEFTFAGGVGTLDGATLRNPSFRITLTGDTADVVLPYGTPDSFALFNLTATIDPRAPGVATFAESFYIESDDFEGLTTLTIGAMSRYPDDFYRLQGFPTAGDPYRLDTSIGPITSPFNAGNFDFSSVATSLGAEHHAGGKRHVPGDGVRRPRTQHDDTPRSGAPRPARCREEGSRAEGSVAGPRLPLHLEDEITNTDPRT